MKWWQHIPLSWGAHVHEDLVFVHHRTNKSTFVKVLTALTALGIVCWVLRRRRACGRDCASGIANLDNAFLKIRHSFFSGRAESRERHFLCFARKTNKSLGLSRQSLLEIPASFASSGLPVHLMSGLTGEVVCHA